jgi:AraC family transcriptional regulator
MQSVRTRQSDFYNIPRPWGQRGEHPRGCRFPPLAFALHVSAVEKAAPPATLARTLLSLQRNVGNPPSRRRVPTSMGQAGAATPAELKPGQFFGAVVEKLVCAGATMSEVVHPKLRRVPEHSHQAAYFSVLLGGGYRETFGSRMVEYALRSVSFHPPGTVHTGEMAANGSRLFAVELDSSWLARVRDFAPLPEFSHYRAGGPLAWLANRLHSEFRLRDPASRLSIEGILLEMLAELARNARAVESEKPAWLATAMELLRAEFRHSLTIDGVARAAGVHPARLSRAFRRRYGQTIGEFINELRVDFAVGELAKDVSLSELSLAAGFADQSHFTRVFRAHTGTTPAKFREQQRPGRSRSKPRITCA